MDIEKIQAYLEEHELGGWLMADFHGRNNIAIEMLGLSGMVTRRSFYFIPVSGEPTALVHAVEFDKFQSVAGNHIQYSSYKQLEDELEKLVSPVSKIAMEYSPMGRLPYIGLVDAGTIELMKSFGCEIVTSANMVANFQARLTPEQIATHRIAAKNVIEIKEHAHSYI
ncbi:MAG: aminopeptidase P family protein, partial [Calditrichaeota bacterium]